MVFQNITKPAQNLWMIFQIFCSTSWTQNQCKSFATIFKDFLNFHQIILNHCKQIAILSKTFFSCYKISQNQCKIFVFCLKMFVLECKKVVKNGIIWIKSKQTVKVFLLKKGFEFLSSNQFNLRKRSKTRKNQVQTSSDFQRDHKVSCLFVHYLMLSFLLVLKYFLWHITVGFRLFLRDFG